MSTVAQCPECGTCFRISQQQLDACHGLARCGRCQAVFNAAAHLLETEPSPQLDLLEVLKKEPAPAEAAPEVHEEPAIQSEAADGSELDFEKTQPMAVLAAKQQEAAAPAPLVQRIRGPESALEHHLALAGKKKKKRVWPWAIGSLMLLALMLGQAVYFLRVEIAARAPGLKPALTSYCALLRCSIALPRKIDLISIESSDLQADPAQANVITFNAILRNQASYAQAYPSLELTFTDTQDKLVARRTFQPSDYLAPDQDWKEGIPARRETSIKLHLDTTDLRPAGYRLFLYYPVAQ